MTAMTRRDMNLVGCVSWPKPLSTNDLQTYMTLMTRRKKERVPCAGWVGYKQRATLSRNRVISVMCVMKSAQLLTGERFEVAASIDDWPGRSNRCSSPVALFYRTSRPDRDELTRGLASPRVHCYQSPAISWPFPPDMMMMSRNVAGACAGGVLPSRWRRRSASLSGTAASAATTLSG
jgi:hypothetical protein